jgi:hypothetical protein
MSSPSAAFEEVKNIFIQHYPIAGFYDVRAAFEDFNDLYEGKYPGYRACNTKFHDKIHTTDALVAIARLIDGYNINSAAKLPMKDVRLALIATILHDTGYIQQQNDRKGTGAKYTLGHVQRSIDFVIRYFKTIGYSKEDSLKAGRIINCTGLSADIKHIKFSGHAERMLGYMLGSADLLGQMASRTYLERLVYLYREFKEGHVKGYSSEAELLKKTLDFYEQTKARLGDTLKGVDKYAVFHFRKRYGVNEDLYRVTIDREITYLKKILDSSSGTFRNMLKRKV